MYAYFKFAVEEEENEEAQEEATKDEAAIQVGFISEEEGSSCVLAAFHWRMIARLVIPDVFCGYGCGMCLPLSGQIYLFSMFCP